jgi:SAM-dependent methyltransferase
VFTRAGDADLAAAALRASWHTAPTLYLRPERLARLLDARIRRIRPGDAAADAGTSSASGRLHAHTGESMRTELRSWLTVTPRQKTPKACGSDEILDGRKPAQMGWYGFVAGRLDGEQVLDVGCGSGEGLKILTAHARSAMGIDLDDRLRRPDVHVEIKSIADMPDKSFDVVVCMDVIEHVVDDKAFVAELFRVARKAVFVTTPNYAMSRNRHPYHVREYTPAEFTHLFEGYGDMTLYAGSAHGFEQVEITRRWPYFLVNALYVWKPTQIAAKVLKRVLGVKVWKHNAALVRVGAAGRQAQSPAAAA